VLIVVYQAEGGGRFVIDIQPRAIPRRFGPPALTLGDAQAAADEYVKYHGHTCSKDCAPWKLLF
jgi:hypothetical protein